MRKTILFVYGTLKRGHCNHRLIADQELLGEVRTEPRYRLIDIGPFPGLVADEANGQAVRGELWVVSECCLGELDEFEEEAGAFIRSELRIAGREEPVQAYFWNRPIPAGAATGSEWPLARSSS